MSDWCEDRTKTIPRLRIAVIDDDPLILNLLCDMLEDRGHIVECFASPIAALARFGVATFDAVVCDIQIPDLNGIEFFQQVSIAYPRYVHRVIFLTGDIFM